MYRLTICLTEAEEKAIFELRKTEDYCRKSAADIARMLIDKGIKADAESKKGK